MQRTTILLASMLLAAGQAHGKSVSVPLDEVRMLAFAQPVSTLYVGNPVIADVTMIDKRHAFIQGKAYGATNIVALDASGVEISNQQVVVFGSGSAVVTLQRGAAQTTYSCAAARCEPSPQPGDGKDPFDENMDQIQKHQALASKGATGGQ
jgi:hypothetical protein